MIRDWIKVESSNVDAIAFDEETKEIIVVFKKGSAYAYDPATTLFESFKLAPSKGQFVNRVFKQGEIKFRRLSA